MREREGEREEEVSVSEEREKQEGEMTEERDGGREGGREGEREGEREGRLEQTRVLFLHSQASVRPIRLQMFLYAWFKVEDQVVESWDTRSANAGNAEL